MNTDEVKLLSQDSHYGPLLDLCKGGPGRSIKIADKTLIAAQDDREFCAIAAVNRHEIAFGIKLFDLEKWFIDSALAPPKLGCTESAAAYIEANHDRLIKKLDDIDPSDARQLAIEKAQKLATQFSAKLIHSSASGAAFYNGSQSALPHLSTRSLNRFGIRVPIDQKSNDNKGVFQRLIKIQQGDEVVAESKIPAALIEAFLEGIDLGIKESARSRDTSVDHRLKQILLPSGSGYLAISPMGSGGISVVVGDAASNLDGKTQEARSIIKSAASASKKIEAEASSEKKRGRPKKDAAGTVKQPAPRIDGQAIEITPELEAAARGYSALRLKFEIGGANPRNATIHWTHRGFQNLLYFTAPTRKQALSDAYRFAYRGGWSPKITGAEAKAFFAQLDGLSGSSVLGASASLKAVAVQATGSLAEIARSCHSQAQDFATALSLELIDVDGILREVDESLLLELRPDAKSIPSLDTFIVRNDFGPTYLLSLAEHITDTLDRLSSRHRADGRPMSAIERTRLVEAIQKNLGL